MIMIEKVLFVKLPLALFLTLVIISDLLKGTQMKNIALLGSTGSIGVNVLNVARHLKEQFRVTAIAAHSNIDLLEQQAKEFHPELIAVYNEEKALELKKRLPYFEVVAGDEGLLAVATHAPAQMVISAMTGTKGLGPTVAAIRAGKNVGLANK